MVWLVCGLVRKSSMLQLKRWKRWFLSYQVAKLQRRQ
ncbi:hypothetical protein KC19_8G022700 [Ceratodon purpureus]|uniref:Uncharacterized protein n=1 Tax=Ceratodon purpureus TaxID=3225 RepID=A0A8T0GZX5_CERPU|nr:hypothetical protein KC19_8G022700 [Ceratodon purpureus]